MRTYSKVTPEGTRDLLFEECSARREAQAKLSRLFSLRGYREVITPGLEYFDVFNLPGAAIPQQEMYKCTDNHGRLLVFRPDTTLPIARMAASRLQGHKKPLRFYYCQNIYRNRPDLSGRSDETAQMGIELMGAGGLRADLEAIATAVAALSACVEDFRVEIGHARFFQVLADQLPVTPGVKEELRATIESKNYAALSELLDPLGDLPAARAMAQLPRLFGGEEALAQAERWFPAGEAKETLAYLKTLYQALRRLGLGDRLMVDLGLVQRNDYYTGVVFSAYVHQHGDAVLLGPVRRPLRKIRRPHARRGLLPGPGQPGGALPAARRPPCGGAGLRGTGPRDRRPASPGPPLRAGPPLRDVPLRDRRGNPGLRQGNGHPQGAPGGGVHPGDGPGVRLRSYPE